MATHQPALLCDLEEHQWYVHMSRDDGADLGVIKSALKDLRADCAAQNVNLGLLFGPTLLADLSDDMPDDFQPYPGYESKDKPRQAKAGIMVLEFPRVSLNL